MIIFDIYFYPRWQIKLNFIENAVKQCFMPNVKLLVITITNIKMRKIFMFNTFIAINVPSYHAVI